MTRRRLRSRNPSNSEETLPTADSPAGKSFIRLPWFLKKSTNVSEIPTARAFWSAGRISVSTPVQVSPVRADNAVPSGNVSRVRAARPADVRRPTFPTARARVLIRVIRTDALRRLRRVQEAERITPVPVRVHPAVRGRSAREVPVRTVPPTNPATVLRVRKQTDPADARRLPAPAIQTVARGSSVPMPERFPLTAIIAQQTPSAPAPAVSWPTAREAV